MADSNHPVFCSPRGTSECFSFSAVVKKRTVSDMQTHTGAAGTDRELLISTQGNSPVSAKDHHFPFYCIFKAEAWCKQCLNNYEPVYLSSALFRIVLKHLPALLQAEPACSICYEVQMRWRWRGFKHRSWDLEKRRDGCCRNYVFDHCNYTCFLQVILSVFEENAVFMQDGRIWLLYMYE